MANDVLDVRPLRKPDKHPTIFASYRALSLGESFDLLNNHDPVHLRDEFDSEYPGAFSWDYLQRGPQVWRIRITKRSLTALPRVLCDTSLVADDTGALGAVWKLQLHERDLDSNIIRLAPDGRIDAYDGPDLDVLIHVLGGSGRLSMELGALELAAGALVWLPRRSRREFTAGPDGLSYLTVHQRRQALTLSAPPSVSAGRLRGDLDD
jgi:uncharacterized protein (DUF2249 family)